jgi:hypothetical protein
MSAICNRIWLRYLVWDAAVVNYLAAMSNIKLRRKVRYSFMQAAMCRSEVMCLTAFSTCERTCSSLLKPLVIGICHM